jgi:hypothetical protein
VSERGWWTGLSCRLCGQRVKITDADAIFHRGLSGDGPTAEHYECRTFRNRVAERLAQVRGSE